MAGNVSVFNVEHGYSNTHAFIIGACCSECQSCSDYPGVLITGVRIYNGPLYVNVIKQTGLSLFEVK